MAVGKWGIRLYRRGLFNGAGGAGGEVCVSSQPYRNSSEKAPPSAGGGGYLAIALAWVVPGLGHWVLGERSRALLFGITIHGLFAMGLLLAGLRAINPPDQAIWSYTQWATGWPMGAAVELAKTRFKQPETEQLLNEEYETGGWRGSGFDLAPSGVRESRAKSFIEAHPLFAYHPKMQDIGAVYCGIAGMLNLLVIFDVLLRVTGSERETPEKKKSGKSGAADSETPKPGTSQAAGGA